MDVGAGSQLIDQPVVLTGSDTLSLRFPGGAEGDVDLGCAIEGHPAPGSRCTFFNKDHFAAGKSAAPIKAARAQELTNGGPEGAASASFCVFSAGCASRFLAGACTRQTLGGFPRQAPLLRCGALATRKPSVTLPDHPFDAGALPLDSAGKAFCGFAIPHRAESWTFAGFQHVID